MNHSLYQDGILKALPFKRLPCSMYGKPFGNIYRMVSHSDRFYRTDFRPQKGGLNGPG